MGRRILSRLPSLLALGLISIEAAAEEHETALWLYGSTGGTLGSAHESSPWRYGVRGSYRFFDALGGNRTAILHMGIGCRLGKGFTLWGGYSYRQTESELAGTFKENRIWQQLSWSSSGWDRGTLRSRTRLEQRRLQGFDGTAIRFRQQFRMDLPLRNRPGLDLILGVEAFIHLRGAEWANQGFVQNRAFIGLGKWVTPKLRFEAGYMNQWLRREGRTDLVNHILVVSLGFR